MNLQDEHNTPFEWTLSCLDIISMFVEIQIVLCVNELVENT